MHAIAPRTHDRCDGKGIGDLIELDGERGVIVCDDPPIVRTINFHSYVPILRPFRLIQSEYESRPVPPNPGVIKRVKAYIQKQIAIEDGPTGS